MKKITLLFLFVLPLFVMAGPTDHVPGNLLVQVEPGADAQEVFESLSHNVPGLQWGKPLSAHMRIYLLSFDAAATDENEVLAMARAAGGIRLAQFNHYIKERLNEPDDTHYVNGNLWDMHNTGQNGGLADADIDAPEAWDISTGGYTVQGDTIVVAVIDGSFFLAHQDLTFQKNYDEISGNSIDDDNNGYVDDFNGWNFVGNSNNVNGTSGSANHGTHVSGTIGGKGNNAMGVAGVNWNMKVLPVRGSSGNESVVVGAYSYIYDLRKKYNSTQGDSGLFIVSTNSSFGVDNGDPVDYPIWCALYDSMGHVGILSAGATANQNFNIDNTGDIPTACSSDFLITVTNTTRMDVKTTNAGYGLTTIDLGAPGSTIYSCTANNNYAALSGTSMATPHVAGAVALMLSVACDQMIDDYRLYPDSIARILKQYLLESTDVLTNLVGITVTGGRLNIYNALLAMDNYPCTVTSDKRSAKLGLQLFDIRPNPSTGQAELFYNLPVNAGAVMEICDLQGKMVQRQTLAHQDNGLHNHVIHLEMLPHGVYMVRLVQQERVSGALRLVKF